METLQVYVGSSFLAGEEENVTGFRIRYRSRGFLERAEMTDYSPDMRCNFFPIKYSNLYNIENAE